MRFKTVGSEIHCLVQLTHDSRSRSLKVIQIITNGKRSSNFLLVINSDHGPISHRLGDMGGYLSKFANCS